MTHKIKLNIKFCKDVYNGRKMFEIRRNDRNYQVGDYIVFTPVGEAGIVYHPVADEKYVITCVVDGWGLEQDFVALGIKNIIVGD